MNKGISIISLVITIVVIIILSTIAIFSGYKTPESANLTRFTQTMDGIRLELADVRADNFLEHRDRDYGAQEVTLVNAPDDFVSISDEASEIKGYLLDMSQLEDNVRFGNGTISGSDVVFGEDDVIVYDKNGTVYYAKGYTHDDQVFYNATAKRSVAESLDLLGGETTP